MSSTKILKQATWPGDDAVAWISRYGLQDNHCRYQWSCCERGASEPRLGPLPWFAFQGLCLETPTHAHSRGAAFISARALCYLLIGSRGSHDCCATLAELKIPPRALPNRGDLHAEARAGVRIYILPQLCASTKNTIVNVQQAHFIMPLLIKGYVLAIPLHTWFSVS